MPRDIFDENKAGLENFQRSLRSVAKDIADVSDILMSMDKRLGVLEESTSVIRGDVTNYNRVSSNIYDTLKEMEVLQVIHSNLPKIKAELDTLDKMDIPVTEKIKVVMRMLRVLARYYISLQSSPLHFSAKTQRKAEIGLSETCSRLSSLCQKILQTHAASSLKKAATILDLDQTWSFPTETLQQFMGLIQQFDNEVLYPISYSSDISSNYVKIKSECLVQLLRSLSSQTDAGQLNEASKEFIQGKEEVAIYLVALARILSATATELLHLYDAETSQALYQRIGKNVISTVTNIIHQREAVYEKQSALDNHVLFPLIHCVKVTEDYMQMNMPFEDVALVGLVSGVGKEAEKIIIASLSSLYNGYCNSSKPIVLSTNGVSDITQGIILFLSNFCQYKDSFYLIESIGDWGWRHELSPDLKPSSTTRELVQNYVMDCLLSHLNSVEESAQTVDTINWKKGVILLNISVYFESACVDSEIATYLDEEHFNNFSELSQKYSSMYMEIWRHCSQNMLDATYTKAKEKPNMSTKDREATKEKFRNFNEQITSIVENHKDSVRFEPTVASFLLQEVRKTVLPLYQRFYDKYITSDFTKYKEKYIRFTKAQLDSYITEAFSPSLS
ncbi:exocyst complex subunit Exo70 [Schizosaccharomyces cryophilus OY26]|uniref:Exocyst complex protein EXO70 n=1 Tax=Schizosaccharomyces cryophilus (strain OY26 / ATCC MYA-4695 / CBS 11777 / NBRC 106824 / NRRL Y48691) TaxID=653667 RepID=S9VZ38_SCHCR|nr:exocyst complex subunit Exo70 [Schizosaccharomyces cryophilus OY26]EPY51085.1 exocyst complex subunit Exo70 [Schizosaccharomyces cryophilus OY26]